MQQWKEQLQSMLAAQRLWIDFLFLDSMLFAPSFLFWFHRVFHLSVVAFWLIIPTENKRIFKIHMKMVNLTSYQVYGFEICHTMNTTGELSGNIKNVTIGTILYFGWYDKRNSNEWIG